MRLVLSKAIEPAERERTLAKFGLELSYWEAGPGQAHFESWTPRDDADDGILGTVDLLTIVRYIDDLPIGVSYFTVDDGSSWPLRIRESFPVLTGEEILERAAASTDGNDRIKATFMLALATGNDVYEPALAELTKSLQHANEDVRLAAILAAGYTTWSVLEPVLKQLTSSDVSPSVRDRAARLLDCVVEYGWTEQ